MDHLILDAHKMKMEHEKYTERVSVIGSEMFPCWVAVIVAYLKITQYVTFYGQKNISIISMSIISQQQKILYNLTLLQQR